LARRTLLLAVQILPVAVAVSCGGSSQLKKRRRSSWLAASILGALFVAGSVACGGSPSGQSAVASPSSSPTPDAATQRYVALIRSYWTGIQDADVVNGINVSARVCLGEATPSSPISFALVDPVACKERALAILAVQQKFLSDLGATPAPPRFAADDQAIRAQIPKAIAAVNALISACASGSKEAVLTAGGAYVDEMVPTVTTALDDIDPTVVHT
jgi:hypothetical protein